ncbi:MAG: CDP-alcohol phosphatidyltransferase family protein [Alphaproteobacteria bacterium]|nr:CDP-alcohol phosphatidyltransferase family protein [Alphaproteobacteria bacterium]MCW5742064.1 CDP-alcohol phosphatidyltransferase family protein [Alphaproteobacteria bacterium]
MLPDLDVGDEMAPVPARGRVLLLRADHVLDDVLARPLAAASDLALASSNTPGIAAIVIDAARMEEGQALLERASEDCARAGLAVATPGQLAGAYRAKLRNRVPPYALSTRATPPRDIERAMYDATYKGITDAVTKYVWPTPAFVATRWCAAARITPNAVTVASFLCVLAATALFAVGWYLPGLLAAWAMCFLDTVDGKLARVTLAASKLGDVLDHGTDLLHPPFWWYAWYAGLGTATLPHLDIAVWIVIAGYVLGRAQEGLFLATFRFEMFGWRPLDALSRLVTARRNPNLVLLSIAALAGRPDIGLAVVAAWTLLCLGFHGVRIAQAFAARAAGRAVTPFLADA